MAEFYTWPISDIATAQAALASLNGDSRLPLIGKNQKTGILQPLKTKTVRWAKAVETFINGTVGFKRIPSGTLQEMGVLEAERQAFLTAFNPTIKEFDISWKAPNVIGHKTVACYGDSMTEGFGFGATDGYDWPAVLQRDYGYESINGGIAGNTPQQMTDRYIAATERHADDFLVLWEAGDNGGTVAEQIAYFNAAIAKATGRYLVLGRCNTNWEIDNNAALLAEYGANNFLDIKSALVIESGQPDYDMYRSDSIHLNDAGYAVVAREIALRLPSVPLN